MPRHLWITAAVVTTALGGRALADSVVVDFENYGTGKVTSSFASTPTTSRNVDQGITNINPISGSESWRISNRPTAAGLDNQPFFPALEDKVGAGQEFNLFTASMEFKGLSGGVTGEGITLCLGNASGQRGNYLRLENTGHDTWKLSAYDYRAGTGFYATDLATSLHANDVHTLAFTLDFGPSPADDVWKVYLDSNAAPVYVGTGWDQYYKDLSPASRYTPALYDRLLFRSGGTSTPGAVGVMFDDIAYCSTVFPPDNALGPDSVVAVPVAPAAWMGISLLTVLGAVAKFRSAFGRRLA